MNAIALPITPPKGLVLAPDVDFPTETDSKEFSSEADKLAKLHGIAPRVAFDNEAVDFSVRARTVLHALADQPIGSLDWVAFCCHGWGRGMQAGFDMRGDAFRHALTPDDLAQALARVGHPGIQLIVPLYACSTAELGDKGFAAKLSLALAAHGCPHRLFAHTTAGHTTRNPYVRLYPGGDWLIAPKSAEWHSWYEKLHDEHNDLRLRYPFMSREDLLAELQKK